MAIEAKSTSEQMIAEEAEKSAQRIIVQSQLAGLISLVPFVGSAINEGLSQLAIKRVYERSREMFEAMGERLREVGESRINREWFQCEEFQTLLFDAIRQATVISDRKKVAMLGSALANSGIVDFNAEHRKELFLQLVRDLTPQHIAMLRKLLPDHSRLPEVRWLSRPKLVPKDKDEDLAVLQMLAADGLVTESLNAPHIPPARFSSYSPLTLSESMDAMQNTVKALQTPPRRTFQLSSFGRDFLDFVSFSRIPE